MKKTIYTLFILLITGLTIGQNLELDKRNGFKQIKLGSTYNSFNGIVDISCKNPNSICGLWKTSDSNLGYLFNDKIDVFELEFDKDSKELKIIRIYIAIQKPYTDPEVFERFKAINEKLISVLGKADRAMTDLMGFMWFGNKVAMGIMLKAEEMKYDTISKIIGSTSIILTFSSIENIKEGTKKGF